jgi:proteasome accessory factor B
MIVPDAVPPTRRDRAHDAQRVPVEERLFSLVLALLATESGLTKHEILSTVQGYRQRYSRAGDNANLERQFERDKDDIRDLGVPLETVEMPEDAGSNHNARYRIPRGSYELPADITFSAEETTLLGLAAMVWREGSLSAESRRALLKLRSLGGVTEDPVLGYTTTLRARDAAFEPLRTALEKHQIVRFDYLKPGEADARARTVVPLALVQHQGRWHLSAEEEGTGARKTFLLRRIVSKVSSTGRTFTPRPGDHTADALGELEQIWASQTAVVEAVPESDAATRLLKRRGTVPTNTGALELHYADVNIVADELAAYGPEVLVLAPPELREAVRSRLERTADDHADASGDADQGPDHG